MPRDSAPRTFHIDERTAGACLDEFLTGRLHRFPRATIRRWIGAGRARVNGNPESAKYRLAAADELVFELPEGGEEGGAGGPDVELCVLVNDPEFAVVDAPACAPAPEPIRPRAGPPVEDGLLVGLEGGASLAEAVLGPGNRRADTSGLAIVARSAAARAALAAAFVARRVAREYLALVTGEIEHEAGRIELSIAPDPRRPGRWRLDKQGEEAITDFEVRERFRGFTFLALRPQTGGTHQLRVHLAGIRHPLAVDPLYGSHSTLFLSELKRGYKKKWGEDERPLITRLTLHAHRVEFPHPTTGVPVRAESPLPKDLAVLLKAVRKHRER